jgi:hypothetical protein
MDPFDDRLRLRLQRLEAAAPAPSTSAATLQPRVRPTSRAPLAAAAALVLIVGSVALTAGAYLDPNGVRGHPGLENEGQPFAGTGLHCLAPLDAQRVIVAHGYTPAWQIEDRPGDGKSGTTTTFSDVAPDHGIVQGGFVEGTVAHVVVSVSADAVPFDDCR